MVTKLMIGLGNPGIKYENNRHNVGFMVVDALSETQNSNVKSQNYLSTLSSRPKGNSKLKSEVLQIGDTLLAKPQTFMNSSGEAISKLVNWYKIEPNDIYVIHDDLDIPLGNYKIQYGRGPRLHYGVQSIEKALGREDFWRVRVGVDNRKAEARRTPGEQYVLQDFTAEETETVNGIIGKIVEELKPIIQ
ncbi:MAG: aminoacyl-tRNA hydrolase [bacterium]|nr:aminoacyl-tRNA hydrolase [bacterium]